jgi:hypothetical protein
MYSAIQLINIWYDLIWLVDVKQLCYIFVTDREISFI